MKIDDKYDEAAYLGAVCYALWETDGAEEGDVFNHLRGILSYTEYVQPDLAQFTNLVKGMVRDYIRRMDEFWPEGIDEMLTFTNDELKSRGPVTEAQIRELVKEDNDND